MRHTVWFAILVSLLVGCGEPCPLGKGQCKAPSAASFADFVGVERAFPALTFDQSIFLTAAGDGSDRIFVVEQTGRIHVFPNRDDVEDTTVFLDLSGRVANTQSEGGVLGLAFHPDFARNGLFFVNYTPFEGGFHTVISRWRVSETDPDRADPDSERVLLTVPQPFRNHNGGMLAFGPDGMLYAALGDGGSKDDPGRHGQNTGTLLGSILRIDVNASGAEPYLIPPDNPLVGVDGARPEIWAWGFRNPWRFSFDRVSGTLWAGDVGQGDIEEIDAVVRGGNYGWRIREGSVCFKSENCRAEGLEPPVLEYPHKVGKSVTGGYVYRGAAVPSLYGTYLYADFVSHAVFAHRQGEESRAVRKLLDAPAPPASFGEDESGELYLVGHSGSLWRFVPRGSPPGPDLPETLTETDFFEDARAEQPSARLAPYKVNAELWSDGATKARFVVPPDGQRLAVDAQGRMQIPEGTTAIKHFDLGDRRLETRVLVKTSEGVLGATYRWDPTGDSALLTLGGGTASIPVDTGEPVAWQYPSSNQCNGCHTEAAGGFLGLQTAQLNRADGQLDALVTAGVMSPLPMPSASLPRMADPSDVAQPVEARARAWLDTNCAHCHQPGASSGTALDLRFDVPLAGTGLCAAPSKGSLGIDGARILAPRAPERSVLLARLSSGPETVMPPLSVTRVDESGVRLLSAWVASVTCP